MSQEMLYISILILILFLMYVYKKKCDEEYYISIIRSTQQQMMFQNQNNARQNYPPHSPITYFNNSYLGSIPYPNNNSFTPNFNCNNYNYNPFKTPENRNYNYSYNNYYNNAPYNNKTDLNERSPSPIKSRAEIKYGYHNNGNKKHVLEDQILFNKLNNINGISINHSNQNLKKLINDDYRYNQNNRTYNPNLNYVNKKVFKLEDFLSESKKNNLSERFDRAAKDDFN